MNESPHLLLDILIVLVAAVAVVPAFRRLGASAVLGYLAAGALIGPHGFDWLSDVEAAAGLGEMGVVFLLFSIGLSLELELLIALRRYALGLGVAQVVLTTVVLWAALRALGVPNAAAVVIGGGLALSSTAVVLQMLVERRELSTPRGRVALAVLLLQDIAVVPLLTLVPLLRGGEAVLPALAGAALRAAVVLAVMFVVGRLALRPLFRAVARHGPPELFTGIVLLLVLGVGWLTHLAGLSMALGAFLAGVLVAETEYRPQVESDIQPFRGLLLALFFMSVGMSLDLALIREQALVLLGATVLLLVVKAGILAGLGRAFRLPLGTALAVGLMLPQGGEFGFVLFALARQAEVLAADLAQLAVLVVGLSMAVTPALVTAAQRLARRLEERGEGPTPATLAEGLRDHVVIAGFGRVGNTIALLLESRGVAYVAVDLDPERVAAARARSLPVYFGDASRSEVLRAAGIERARALVITVDEPAAANRAAHLARQLAPQVPVVVRVRDLGQAAELDRGGVTAVVPEIVEGSLRLGAVVLRQVGASRTDVEQVLAAFRRRTYAELARLSPLPPDDDEPPPTQQG